MEPFTSEEMCEMRNDLWQSLIDYRHAANRLTDDDATTNVLKMWVRKLESKTGQEPKRIR